MTSKNILSSFREILQKNKLSWYILPRTDDHQSEYICECDKRVQFISGFSGTNAFTIISQTQALLWTDGRYFSQALKQLKEGWTLKKLIPEDKKWHQHICLNPKQEGDFMRIGIDSRLISASTATQIFPKLKEAGYQIVDAPQNLIDLIWQNRPASTACQIFIHEEWAGKPIKEKVAWVRQNITEKNGSGALFSGLSQIAWILNLRSAEIPFNPYFKSILKITPQAGTLYLSKDHVSFADPAIKKHLDTVNISIEDFTPSSIKFEPKTLIQKSSVNYFLFSKLTDPIEWSSGIGLYRAVRENKQIQGFRNCHIRDGVAMAKFWAWRSEQLPICNQYQAALYMNKLRSQQQHSKGNSFETTSAGGPNAAVIHYKPKPESNLDITQQMIHLVDSGGQYLDGTTDVTRTFHFGKPTEQEKDANTRVLLGNLDVERMRWPKNVNIKGRDLDVIARRHLYAKGLNYLHGTGHGVGYYLGVHEGPVGIFQVNQVVFKPGMIVSNQPGYYKDGHFGIRIQNLIIVREVQDCYEFQNLTLCPYDRNLIDRSLLSQKDIDYIDAYHKKVFNILSERLQNDQKTLNWLKAATQPL